MTLTPSQSLTFDWQVCQSLTFDWQVCLSLYWNKDEWLSQWESSYIIFAKGKNNIPVCVARGDLWCPPLHDFWAAHTILSKFFQPQMGNATLCASSAPNCGCSKARHNAAKHTSFSLTTNELFQKSFGVIGLVFGAHVHCHRYDPNKIKHKGPFLETTSPPSFCKGNSQR